MEIKQLQLRAQAQQLYETAIEYAQPAHTLPAALQTCLPELERILKDQRGYQHWHLLGFGKAAYAMAKTVLDTSGLNQAPQTVSLITQSSPPQSLSNIEILLADHPYPTEKNLLATNQFIRKLRQIHRDEPIIMLISGGGSAMLCAPRPGISLAALQATTKALLNANCDIKSINIVRKHLSSVKGGQLAQIIPARPIFAFVISDVLGNDLSSIASGPLVGDPSTFAEALSVIQRHGLENQIPLEVRAYLQSGVTGIYPETPMPDNSCFDGVVHSIIASNRQSVDAMLERAASLGLHARILAYDLSGEVRQVAQQLVDWIIHSHRTISGPQAYVSGGETTVHVSGHGKGGRNQELGLAFALAMAAHKIDYPWVFLSAGTDGRDGPTDAAGVIVDNHTLTRGKAKNRDPVKDLENNNSHAFLQASGDLIRARQTGTNVADVQAFLSSY